MSIPYFKMDLFREKKMGRLYYKGSGDHSISPPGTLDPSRRGILFWLSYWEETEAIRKAPSI